MPSKIEGDISIMSGFQWKEGGWRARWSIWKARFEIGLQSSREQGGKRWV
jgi:hypothetical protein